MTPNILIYVFVDPHSDRYRSHPKAVELAERIHAEPWMTFSEREKRSNPSS